MKWNGFDNLRRYERDLQNDLRKLQRWLKELDDRVARYEPPGIKGGSSSISIYNTYNQPAIGSGVATRVTYWDAPAHITSDSELYYDDVNKRLGIGSSAPVATLHVEAQTAQTADLAAFADATSTVQTVVDVAGHVGINADPTAWLEIQQTTEDPDGTYIAGLLPKIWYQPSGITHDGTYVTAWTNDGSSGSAGNLAPALATKFKVDLASTDFNGLNVLDGRTSAPYSVDATASMAVPGAVVTGCNASGAFTLFVVLKLVANKTPGSNATDNGLVCNTTTPVGSGHATAVQTPTTVTSTFSETCSLLNTTGFFFTTWTSALACGTGLQLIEYSSPDGRTFTRTNHSNGATETITPITAPNFGTPLEVGSLACDYIGSPTFWVRTLDGRVAEFLCFDSNLAEPVRVNVRQYLKAKYNAWSYAPLGTAVDYVRWVDTSDNILGLVDDTYGRLGLHGQGWSTNTPATRLHVVDTTWPQVRVGYDLTGYLSIGMRTRPAPNTYLGFVEPATTTTARGQDFVFLGGGTTGGDRAGHLEMGGGYNDGTTVGGDALFYGGYSAADGFNPARMTLHAGGRAYTLFDPDTTTYVATVGGDALLEGGSLVSAAPGTVGGNVVLRGGLGETGGAVWIRKAPVGGTPNVASYGVKFDVSAATADRTMTLPNADCYPITDTNYGDVQVASSGQSWTVSGSSAPYFVVSGDDPTLSFRDTGASPTGGPYSSSIICETNEVSGAGGLVIRGSARIRPYFPNDSDAAHMHVYVEGLLMLPTWDEQPVQGGAIDPLNTPGFPVADVSPNITSTGGGLYCLAHVPTVEEPRSGSDLWFVDAQTGSRWRLSTYLDTPGGAAVAASAAMAYITWSDQTTQLTGSKWLNFGTPDSLYDNGDATSVQPAINTSWANDWQVDQTFSAGLTSASIQSAAADGTTAFTLTDTLTARSTGYTLDLVRSGTPTYLMRVSWDGRFAFGYGSSVTLTPQVGHVLSFLASDSNDPTGSPKYVGILSHLSHSATTETLPSAYGIVGSYTVYTPTGFNPTIVGGIRGTVGSGTAGSGLSAKYAAGVIAGFTGSGNISDIEPSGPDQTFIKSAQPEGDWAHLTGFWCDFLQVSSTTNIGVRPAILSSARLPIQYLTGSTSAAAPTGTSCAIYGEDPGTGTALYPLHTYFARIAYPRKTGGTGVHATHLYFEPWPNTATIRGGGVAGDVYYDDGTNFTAGLWEYAGGAWSKLIGSTIPNAQNITLGTVTGTKLGTDPTQLLGFWNATPVAQSTGWAVTSEVTTKSFDADTVTHDQLADVVGTLIETLKTYGILGA